MANQSEVKFMNIDQFVKKLEDMPKVVAKQLLPYVVELTPHDKGNAREHTTYDGNVTINANYDYAERLLHQGWSDQLAAGTFDDKVKIRVDQLVNDYIRKL